MEKYTNKPENQSRTLDNDPRASKQAPISDILQAYKNTTLDRYKQVPKQEKYLSRELERVIQQMKGPVCPTVSLNNIFVSCEPKLEKKAEAFSDRIIGKSTFGNVIQMLKISNDIGGLTEGDSNVTSLVYALVKKRMK